MAADSKIALGGGCHWCTEAVFQSLKGVEKVEQGYVASTESHSAFSEAVIVHYDSKKIPLERLIEIHLHTHNSTSNHSMRSKYRSAVYFYNSDQKVEAEKALMTLQASFSEKIVTKVYPFGAFEPSREQIQNYYLKNPEKPFCKAYIEPKLKLLLQEFSEDLQK
ncbi:peptide-methionine (S)-S-oxide reductase [Salegentibacter sp. F188]|uniref:peptide-methionine (S)-S-oxide reductase n=1 Tax=Autumnicola patrickiae TaxID=3075591 RepID=A0ABU3E2J0_9FLAO|nr:peptide-methionine (S)-S-oxide reductase [Salegentibacter sp. F188]MDT0690152.1 peptide-methionine (S)-S-oxide reductase [Salegentibacter sp. F188]